MTVDWSLARWILAGTLVFSTLIVVGALVGPDLWKHFKKWRREDKDDPEP